MGNDDFSPTDNMTGGSLPAMTWERLMTYAHQNIELKPIPGIENPFVEKELVAEAEADDTQAPDAAAEEERPALLSSRTTKLLTDMADAFRQAPIVRLPDQPETLSAL